MERKFDVATVNRLLGIDEAFKVPDRLMEIVFDKGLREKVFGSFLEVSTDVSYDWFHDYFEEEQAERKSKKQDFTPNEVSEIMNRLTGQHTGTTFEPTAGTGGITINKWWQDCLQETPLTYMPHEHVYWCEELSDRAIPFLLFNLAIRGMNAVVWHGDALTRECRGVFLVENPTDDFLAFSDVNIMPYSEATKKYFQVSKWVGDRYPEHIETDLDEWFRHVDYNLQFKAKWGVPLARPTGSIQ
ncbi:N-6 DNA methylase [Furfurilactobacillus rossiae]|uniref:DNA methylase adenine-specific domain-containing protein n=1 Tax=Furfurilactobacillus rossiae DSM 15814 TaxID=1114972 RepID=A0A0R1RK25_9LACO|nr:N-6 DNA methylase [Furfurilactobacillus rossiae]KRL56649.1 hypothetical protein FD35_GL001746 [Furfurilactobacillus rossiae DSM 15814]QFR66449.1 N-6 DNA methylase [Furfurilactobacillus rossiae]QLE61907.1 Type I restriction-modification system DNA-methyltransferase subunit M [Furfurilactobacillus rossiae]